MIKIPIRCICPYPPEHALNETENLIQKKLNRVFYPNSDEHHHGQISSKPIVILWWFTQINTEIVRVDVVPLFPVSRPVSYHFQIDLLKKISFYSNIRNRKSSIA